MNLKKYEDGKIDKIEEKPLEIQAKKKSGNTGNEAFHFQKRLPYFDCAKKVFI